MGKYTFFTRYQDYIPSYFVSRNIYKSGFHVFVFAIIHILIIGYFITFNIY